MEKYSGALVDAALAAHAGGVDEAHRPSPVSTMVSIESRVVPGHVVDDGPVLADEAVEQRRLAHVGTPHDGHAEDGAAVLHRGDPAVILGGRRTAEGVEQVAGAAAVQRLTARVAQAEADELPDRFAAAVVDLVGHHQHRAFEAAQQLGDAGVLLDDAEGGVDHEEGWRRPSIARLALAAHLGVEVGAAGSHPPVSTRVNGPLPLGHDLLAVPGDAGLLLDDRLAAAHDPVEQGRLPTLGRLTTATTGSSRSRGAARSVGRRWGRPRPGREVGRGGAVEEEAPGQADVGQQVAVAGGLGRPAPGEVRPRAGP